MKQIPRWISAGPNVHLHFHEEESIQNGNVRILSVQI